MNSEFGKKELIDWIIEVVSPSSQSMDYMTKLFKYRTAGVREYWIQNNDISVAEVRYKTFQQTRLC